MNDNKTKIKQSRSKSEFIEFAKSITERNLMYDELKRINAEYRRPNARKPFSGFAVVRTLLVNEDGSVDEKFSVNYINNGQLKQFKTFRASEKFQSQGQYEQKGPMKQNIKHGSWSTYFSNGKKIIWSL